MSEQRIAFTSCGGVASVLASGGPGVGRAVGDVRRLIADWERRLTRFDPQSELSRLNAARATHVRASDLMCRFASAAVEAAASTGGLVDPTLVDEVQLAGYRTTIGRPLPLPIALQFTAERAPGRPDPAARWSQIRVDERRGVIVRPRGVKLDSGGVAKGLFADMAADLLAGLDTWCVDVCGDLRIGGSAAKPRCVRVDDPFGGVPLHEFRVRAGGVATSGIGRRSWLGADGRPAHHLLDPATGRPAFTGIVQATALAPAAVEAEALAKAALLEGPGRAAFRLVHGGVIVFDDGSHDVIEPQAKALAA